MASRFLSLLSISVVLSSPISPYRLPEGAVEVIHYQIQLRVTEETFTTAPNQYKGITNIIFRNLRNTTEIKLHANEIEFSNVTLINQSGNKIEIVSRSLNTTTDILTLRSAATLPAETFYEILFEFVGLLRTDGLDGFYRSSYINPAGETSYLGVTQMESTNARKAFPCFDEPSLKAEFDISIRHPVRYNAVGNTVGNRIIDPSNQSFAVTTFEATPRMSTYLIAFIISDFTCSQGADIEASVAHYVCSRDGGRRDRALANEYGPKLTRALEEFTGVKFSESRIGKIHQFAIPDFSAGAMENWGLITYREQYLLWNSQESSNRNKQNTITIIAHELAHFWFGNYVTCDWWSNIFLNEGFATFFEYTIPQIVDSTFETDKQFVLYELQPVLVTDAAPDSTPLSSPANTQAEISNKFDSIVYNKAGSIFRMVEHFMGRENFRRGLTSYLRTNRFGNTKPENLWTALQEYTPVSLTTVMENWTYKAGFPLLNVTSNGSNIAITQSRFLSTEDEPSPEDQWYVPISYTTTATLNKFQNTSPSVWLAPGGRVNISLATKSDWIILNNQQTGYYRVDYDANLWGKIRTALNRPGFDGIKELNRAQLVDDFYNFARYGRKSFTELLELYTFLKKDTSYYVWYSALNALSAIIQRTTNEQLVRYLNSYISELMEVVYNSVPFNEAKDDNQMYTLTKTLVVPWACRLDFQDCVDNTLSAFTRYRTTREKLDKNLKSTILCNGLRHSTNVADWNFLYNEYLTTTLATEKSTILTVLGCSKDPNILKDYLRRSIDSTSGIRKQDANWVFSAVYTGNPEGVDIAFDFLIANYQAMANYYSSMNALNNIFSGLASKFTRTNQTDKLRTFIETSDLGKAADSAKTALSSALTNLQYTAKFEEELIAYFIKQPTGSGSSLELGFATFVTTVLVLWYQFL